MPSASPSPSLGSASGKKATGAVRGASLERGHQGKLRGVKGWSSRSTRSLGRVPLGRENFCPEQLRYIIFQSKENLHNNYIHVKHGDNNAVFLCSTAQYGLGPYRSQRTLHKKKKEKNKQKKRSTIHFMID